MGKSITRSIYMNPKLVDAFETFCQIVDSIKPDEYWKKSEVLAELEKKSVFISKSTLDVFIRLRIKFQKSTKKIAEFKNVIKVVD